MHRNREADDSRSFSWWVDDLVDAPASSFRTASEQMFFLGAPLAHIVRYEHELKLQRERRGGFAAAVPLAPAGIEVGLCKADAETDR
jgi:hypothetical protein